LDPGRFDDLDLRKERRSEACSLGFPVCKASLPAAFAQGGCDGRDP
jgi:hypothetical protein